MPQRPSYSHYIDMKLGIIAHKHMGENDPEMVDFDLEEMAFYALIRALADYIKLNGQEEPFVKAFLSWAWTNTNNKALMEEYMKVSKKLKPL